MFRKRHLPAVVAAVCLLLTAAACNGDPDAQTSPTPTSTTWSTPTPTRPSIAPPTMPAAAQGGLTITSAEAFARFYLAALDYSAATGDARLIRQFQDKACSNCNSIANLHETTYRAGGIITNQHGTRIVETTQARLLRKDGAIVVFKTMAGRTTMRPSATSKPTVLPGRLSTIDLTLKARNNHWSVLWLEVPA